MSIDEPRRRASDRKARFDPGPESPKGTSGEGHLLHAENDPGDASIERRQRDIEWGGPERRIGRA